MVKRTISPPGSGYQPEPSETMGEGSPPKMPNCKPPKSEIPTESEIAGEIANAIGRILSQYPSQSFKIEVERISEDGTAIGIDIALTARR